jgi:hypothetical protein
MCSEDPILGGKILDLQNQLLIDEPADVRQNRSQVTNFHPRCIFSDHQFSTAYNYLDQGNVSRAQAACNRDLSLFEPHPETIVCSTARVTPSTLETALCGLK